MGKYYSTTGTSLTFTATADNASLTANGYIGISTNGAGNFCKVREAYIGGEATSSTPSAMCVRRHTTSAVTVTLKAPSPLFAGGSAATHRGFQTAGTQPVVALLATIEHVLNLGLNLFGGIVRWVAAPDEDIWVYGTAANTQEISISPVTGTGVASAHFVMEEM